MADSIGTTAFDAKASLFTLFSTAIGDGESLAGVDIWYSYNGASTEMPREVVWLGEVDWLDETDESLGAMHRVEEYEIVLTVEVHRPGDTQEEANARTEELFQAVEGLLRQRNPLGLPNIQSCGIKPKVLGEGRDADGRGAILVSKIRVRARI